MDNDSVSLDFHIDGHGWAALRLTLGTRTHVIESVSHVTDALGDLARAALVIATGGDARVRLDSEPTEFRLVLTNFLDTTTGKGPVSLTVLSFDNISANEPDERGHKEFYADSGALAFASAVLDCVKTQKGEPDWNQPFPLSALRALEVALSTRDIPFQPAESGQS